MECDIFPLVAFTVTVYVPGGVIEKSDASLHPLSPTANRKHSARRTQVALLRRHRGRPKGASRPRKTRPLACPPKGSRYWLAVLDELAVDTLTFEFAVAAALRVASEAVQDAASMEDGKSHDMVTVPEKPFSDVIGMTTLPDWPWVIVIVGTLSGRLKLAAASAAAATLKLVVAVAAV